MSTIDKLEDRVEILKNENVNLESQLGEYIRVRKEEVLSQ